jgi:hypothetical protein
MPRLTALKSSPWHSGGRTEFHFTEATDWHKPLLLSVKFSRPAACFAV